MMGLFKWLIIIVVIIGLVWYFAPATFHQGLDAAKGIFSKAKNGTLIKNDTTSIANPAATFCNNRGGTSNIITAPNGSQSGTCTLTNGTVCDEWAYYRGTCP
jgi:putative hemolysin